ncbi:hypothetical protein DICVIV_00298 [Dictyocaulus viviparus]|uniref:Uncharacterized protein n=1 Tax=Dictyocaulus viviparus TaxID=29172 RepID=A0A0D8Y9M5_DICVI|nr:hypothetical protein DICVIV_00298 [Dictyocaulus viviparus]
MLTARDIVPVITAGVPRSVVRTSHRNNLEKKEKKVERLFATPNAKIEEREPLQEDEEELVSNDVSPSVNWEGRWFGCGTDDEYCMNTVLLKER